MHTYTALDREVSEGRRRVLVIDPARVLDLNVTGDLPLYVDGTKVFVP